MNFGDLLRVARGLSVIESANLSGLGEDPRALAVQLNRWTASGKLIRLKRGVYLLAREYRTREPALEYIANVLVRPSFVSREYALSFHGMIPEAPGLVTGVTTARPVSLTTPVKDFDFRHVSRDRFFGYLSYAMPEGEAWIATPERALLDLAYFSKGELTRQRIEQLRLQQLEKVDASRLVEMAQRFRSPKLARAAYELAQYAKAEIQETTDL
jgi:predicted transcriptional regulator of viral defense system